MDFLPGWIFLARRAREISFHLDLTRNFARMRLSSNSCLRKSVSPEQLIKIAAGELDAGILRPVEHKLPYLETKVRISEIALCYGSDETSLAVLNSSKS